MNTILKRHKHNLLVADDEPIVLDIISAIFANEYSITCVESGTGLVKELVANPRKYDACIVDINLPGCKGDKAISEAIMKGVEVPVVFISSQGDIHYRKPQNIPSTIMHKPFLPPEIRAIVRAMIKNYRRYQPIEI